jgi:hypothetical protein
MEVGDLLQHKISKHIGILEDFNNRHHYKVRFVSFLCVEDMGYHKYASYSTIDELMHSWSIV